MLPQVCDSFVWSHKHVQKEGGTTKTTWGMPALVMELEAVRAKKAKLAFDDLTVLQVYQHLFDEKQRHEIDEFVKGCIGAVSAASKRKSSVGSTSAAKKGKAGSSSASGSAATLDSDQAEKAAIIAALCS